MVREKYLFLEKGNVITAYDKNSMYGLCNDNKYSIVVADNIEQFDKHEYKEFNISQKEFQRVISFNNKIQNKVIKLTDKLTIQVK